MGSKTMQRSPAFPPVLTRYKLLEIERLGFGNRRTLMEPLLREGFHLLALDHTSVTHEGNPADAKHALELGNLRSQGLRLLGIAGKDLNGDRLPLLVAE